MKPHELLTHLAEIAPMIAITVHWEHDPDAKWERDWTKEGMDRDDFQAWQSEVRATVVHKGRLVTGSDYLCGTWEKYGEHPSKSNPDISGYLPQKIEEAVQDLRRQISDSARDVTRQCGALFFAIRKELRDRHAAPAPAA